MHDAELRVAWEGAVGTHPDAAGLLDDIVARYREPHRRYHSVTHLVWVVRHLRDLAATDEVHRADPDLGAVVAAAFLHDAVYDPARSDNEERSATLARRRLTDLGWEPARVELVAWLVEATAHVTGRDPAAERAGDAARMAAAVLLDADLAVLGSEPAAYQAYVTGVRAEYAHVPPDAWRTGRRAVLQTLLAHEPLYRTAAARDRWERRARANLAAELAALA